MKPHLDGQVKFLELSLQLRSSTVPRWRMLKNGLKKQVFPKAVKLICMMVEQVKNSIRKLPVVTSTCLNSVTLWMIKFMQGQLDHTHSLLSSLLAVKHNLAVRGLEKWKYGH